MSDGSPPRLLGPGQTMLFGSKSNGMFLATTGTGGSLDIPLDGTTATINWSVPRNTFNGGFPWWENCNGGVNTTSNGSAFGPDATVSGGLNGESTRGIGQQNTCWFSFGLTPNSGGGSGGGSCTQGNKGKLASGQALTWPTKCPGGVNCSGGYTVATSADGSTTLAINRRTSGANPSGESSSLIVQTALGQMQGKTPWSRSCRRTEI